METKTFSVQGLFSVSTCLITITFRSSPGSGEKQHIILKGAAFRRKLPPRVGDSSSGVLEVLEIVPAAVLPIISGFCS